MTLLFPQGRETLRRCKTSWMPKNSFKGQGGGHEPWHQASLQRLQDAGYAARWELHHRDSPQQLRYEGGHPTIK